MSQKYLIFDSETGGLNENEEDLLTWYGAILDENFKVIDELDLKLKPDGGRLPIANPGALKVNGIDLQKHIADPNTVEYSVGKAKLLELINKHLKKRGRFSNITPMGYNVPFDVRWTQKHLLPQNEWEKLLHYKICDVMQNIDFLKMIGWVPSDLGSLTEVVDYFGIPKRDAHNAREDTLMTLDVHLKVLEFMESRKGSSQESTDLISLLEAE